MYYRKLKMCIENHRITKLKRYITKKLLGNIKQNHKNTQKQDDKRKTMEPRKNRMHRNRTIQKRCEI